MNTPAKKYLWLSFAFVMGVILLGFPLLCGVWLPDVIFAARHTLVSKTLPSGHTFCVIQYWNRGDFYTTELQITSPTGQISTHTLDGDDGKSWRLPLVIDEYRHTVTVTLGGGRVRKVDWK